MKISDAIYQRIKHYMAKNPYGIYTRQLVFQNLLLIHYLAQKELKLFK